MLYRCLLPSLFFFLPTVLVHLLVYGKGLMYHEFLSRDFFWSRMRFSWCSLESLLTLLFLWCSGLRCFWIVLPENSTSHWEKEMITAIEKCRDGMHLMDWKLLALFTEVLWVVIIFYVCLALGEYFIMDHVTNKSAEGSKYSLS